MIKIDEKIPEKENTSFLDKLREEAKGQALDEFREIERKALLATMLDEERAKLRPPEPEPEPEEIVMVTIDVPPNMFVNQANETGVTINGQLYIHGRTYPVSPGLAADLNHLMFRANYNERTMGSPNREMNRRKIIDARVGQTAIDARVI